ncbi:MAG: hypothetical protein H6898_03155 [Rhodobacter sp.]|nr:hypothetical protein [Paracoccaceae bacterium]MCC0075563.1 hypothetical protein [Rhodobacter sp.]
MALDAAIVLTIALAAVTLWSPGLRRRATWRAMVTPLASIIGSGFLVLAPVLDHAYGMYAPLAMLALCAVAWGFGAAIRFNIAAIGDQPGTQDAAWAETLASLLLGFAFVVSVAYYLNLLGAFALSLTPWADPTSARAMTTAVYGLILIAGWTGGFKRLESMEYAAVALKLSIIAGLLVALLWFGSGKAATHRLDFTPLSVGPWQALTLGFGLIVTVQGFETSRYLGRSYDPDTRIRSMKLAQVIATTIYVVYILLTAYSFAPGDVTLSETAIVDMMGIVSPVLPVVLVVAALAAQFSAAVADTSGSGGLLAEVSANRLKPRQSYAITVAIGLLITWNADVFQIIAYASRAFAAYYAVQAGLAAWRAWPVAPGKAAGFAALAILGVLIVAFGTPVE